MPFWKSISNAFSNLWNKLGNQNTNSTHSKSQEDDYNKRRRVFSPSDDGDRQSNLSQSDTKEHERIQSACDTWGYSRAVTSYREENIHSRGSYANASQSKPVSAYSSHVSGTRTSLGLSSHKESTQPGRSYISPAPEISPTLAYSSNCGWTSHRPAAPSSRESAQIQSASIATGVKVAPLPVSWGSLEHKSHPVVGSTRRENVEPQKRMPASAAQVKTPAVMLANAGHPQPRSERPSMMQFAVDQRACTLDAQQQQLRRSLTTSERSRSLVSQDKSLPSLIQATRRSSASELVPEKNRIPKSQVRKIVRNSEGWPGIG